MRLLFDDLHNRVPGDMKSGNTVELLQAGEMPLAGGFLSVLLLLMARIVFWSARKRRQKPRLVSDDWHCRMFGDVKTKT
jgi:hypothetical protein